MQTLAEIRDLLERHGLRPQHRFGQNFLTDHNLITKLVDQAGVSAGSLVLEVGPGTGTLTEALLARDADVIAVEIDRGMCGLLRERFAEAIESGRLTLIEHDCLAKDRTLAGPVVEVLAERAFVLCANLPYASATPLISALLVHHPECGRLAATIQREVADRLLAEPGSPAFGAISVLCHALADTERIATLPPECFWPRPDVTSAMVLLTRKSDQALDADALSEGLRHVFAAPRKQLGSALKRSIGPAWSPECAPSSIDLGARAHELTMEQLIDLALAAASCGKGATR